MSAAEKLKALDERMSRQPYVSASIRKDESTLADLAEDYLRLRNALPQIVAVVEAAETVHQDLFFDPVLAAALSALDEALG